MPRTPVRRVGQESASLQAVVPWCSSCNRLMGEMVRCAGEVNYFRYYKRLGPIAKLATSYIENIRERFVTEGFEITLHGKPKRRVRGKVLDGIQEAKIIALRLGSPPSGFANWTLRLLAAQAVALELVESVSHETLRRTLKKTILRTGRSHIGSFRRPPMPSLQQVWRTCLRSMPNPMMRGIRYSAWVSNRSSS